MIMETQRTCPNCRKPLPPDVPLGLCPKCLIKSGFPTETAPGAGGVGRFTPPPVEEISRLFPQFEILGFIGKGGMGAVYKARQPGLDRLVALKVLPPAVASDPSFAERFTREARALARLNHPNIVAVYDFGMAGALHYLVMEFVDGTNLREVERSAQLSPEQALAIVPQICEALQFAHNEGIVHRDIKPENLLLDKKGRVKITDFGIAKLLDVPTGKASLTGAKDVVGTPHYMAPEQIEKPQTVDHRADIYSLGVVFYEMLTGELPLGKFAPPSKKAQVDARLDEVVLHTLEKEPERRYQQANQVKTDVETIAGTPPKPSQANPTPQHRFTNSPAPQTRKSWWRILAGAVTAGLILCLIGSLLFLRSLRNAVAISPPPALPAQPAMPAAPAMPAVPASAPMPPAVAPMKPAAPATPVPPAAPNGMAPPLSQAAFTSNINPGSKTVKAGDSTDLTQAFDVGPDGKLKMNVDRGAVRITGTDENTVTVHLTRQVTGASDSEPSQILNDERVVFTQDGNVISIKAQNPPELQHLSLFGHHPNLDAQYEITLPRRFDTQAETSGGDINVSGIQDGADVKTMGGRISCDDIAGDIHANTMGGDVRATECKGRLDLETMGGNITIDGFAGPDVQATTLGGSVSAEFAIAPTKDSELKTSGGSITVRLPDNAALQLEGQAFAGTERSDFPIEINDRFGNGTLSGAINGGGPVLRMETDAGNVEIKRK
jgi:serine/threonine protein kinase